MGQRENLQNFTQSMWNVQLRQEQEQDQDQERGQALEATSLAEVAKADWPALPPHQVEEVQQGQSVPRGHKAWKRKG